MTNDLYEAGAKLMETLAGDYALALERALVAFGFGDICKRPGLDLKHREPVTVAALSALGTAPRQLKAHIAGALNVGWHQEEIGEAIVQSPSTPVCQRR